jgi:large subunit ribosomal protein L25
MAGERVRLEVRERAAHGSRESRRLRRSGLIPGVLYGRGAVHPIAIPERELRRALGGRGGTHAILDVVLDGGGDGRTHPAILKDFQRDPVRGTVIHVDLHEVRLDRPIQTAVAVVLTGESAGVKEGGVLQQVTREVNVEALPMKIPEHLELDVSRLGIGESLRVADLTPVEDVTYLDDPDETVLATVSAPTVVEEPEEELEEGEEVEGLAEGEEAPEGAAEAPAEPEGDAARSPGTTPG